MREKQKAKEHCMHTDYVPTSDAAFQTWAHQLLSYTATHAAAWNVPSDAYTSVMSDYVGWEVDYEKAKSPTHSSVDILKKNEGRAALEKAIRNLVNQYLRYNPAVTDTDRVAMGLPVPDPHHTPVPPPATVPEAEAKTPYPMVVEIHFHDEGREKRGKPAGVHGAKILYAVLDAPPATVESLTQSAFDPRSPFTLSFEENQRGKVLYFALHWENAKGEAGPWSVIQKAIIA
jgi:hypothetical protein